jgi:aminoglycoside 6'-N-acetyltransferase I
MITIRKGRASDRDGLVLMRKALWPECPENRQELEMAQILSDKGIVLLAESSSSGLVGFAEISLRTDHVEGTTSSPVPYLEGWYVEPSYRSQGIGKALLRSVEDFAVQAGYAELASDAELKNHDSIKIHQHFGFREVGRTVHFIKSLAGNHS